ncbi:hypothetical protein H6P81_016633 [Aristolochia fimbriata]|uniref:PHD finger protein n=1 Tax=Aristolochia fimbriata TaxID=158543 RepID=A0AAV7EDH4_ARIFI|nr:hypothetical protein H6P81_016633 [Aristolochia fimbriata]
MDVVATVNNLVQETEISLPNDKPSSDAGDLESEERVRKKPRVNSGDDLKRVAEIIMVLSAMGKVRAGRNPSAAEKGLMVEAREKLAEICESLAPKDLLSRDAVRVVMEDLGLQKVKEPWAMEFRPSKLSISQRLTLSKRKMEEAQKFASQASHTSRTHTVSLGAKPDGQGVQVHPGGSHRFPLEKHNPTTLSSGNFQTTSPIVPVSAMPTVSAALNPPAVSGEVQAQPAIILMNPSSSTSAANDSHSFVLPRTEPAHFILEQPHNGPSYLFPVRANTSGDNLQENTLSSSLTPSVAQPKVSASNKVLDHNSIISERSQEPNNFQVPSQAIRDPNPKPFAVQTAAFQGSTFVQQPSTFYTPHNDIARNVQKVLQPKVSDPPEWIPPSIDYMNRPMICEVCKLIINDVESLLVCDACEKGVHIKCLQSFNQKVIPKGEWHCLKCVAISNGRPLPPKYGRVSRNAGTQKASMASSGIQAFSDKKAENTDQKIGHHQKLLANGNPGLLSAAQSASVGNISSEPSEDIKATSKTEPLVATSSILSTEGACTRISDDPSKERAVQSGLPSVSEEDGNQNAQNKMSTVVHNLTPKVETRSLSYCSVEIVQGSSSQAETLCSLHSDNKTQVHIGDLVSDQISEAIKSTSESHRPASSQDAAVINSEVEQTEKEENRVIVEGGNADRPADNRSSVQALPDVEWVGDIIKVVDEKIYYGSCSINGVVFKLQDYVLFASKQDNFLPSKLQGLWEDSKTKLRWAILNKCFFPNELPEVVGRPCTPETNEVYESNHANVVAAHLIRGSCQVLPPIKFEVENERRKGKPSLGLNPIFLSKWFYDESKGLFRPVTD